MVWKDVGSKTRKMLHPRGILKKKLWVPSTIFGKRKHHGTSRDSTSPWNFSYDDSGTPNIKLHQWVFNNLDRTSNS